MEPRLSELKVERQGREGGKREGGPHKEVNVKGRDKQFTAANSQGFLRELDRNEMGSSYLYWRCKDWRE